MTRMSYLPAVLVIGIAVATTTGCYVMRPSNGGGQTSFAPPRVIQPSDIALPAGYRIEAVATGLTFPTGVTFDDTGAPYVVEAGYSYGEVWTIPRLLKINPDKSVTEIARGEKNGPWTGAVYANGNFYIAEGGELEGGRILRINRDGSVVRLIENLPSKGDHHTNGPAVGPDGKIYFGIGTATNSAVVGPENAKFGWLKRYPRFHDTPCQDVTLAGENFESPDVLNPGNSNPVKTGAFSPFGKETTAGQVIKGELPCNGAVMRINANGGGLELVAWGFRNPFGLAFDPGGHLYVTDNGYDDRGSRPVWGTGDHLWRVTSGGWYGWPDFSGNVPINMDAYRPPKKSTPPRVLQTHPGTPPKPAAVLGVHASAAGLDFSRSDSFGYTGQAFIAEFGDMSPDTGKSLFPVGYKVVRVDVSTGTIEDFAVNKGTVNAPASKLGSGGLERPVAARFDSSGNALYVVDFGVMLMDAQGPKPQPGTGVLWKITR